MISRSTVSSSIALLMIAIGLSFLRPPAAVAQTIKHNCSFCHDLHGASYPQLSNFELQEDLCWSCHDNAILNDTQVLRDGVLVDVPQNGYDVHYGAKHETFGRDTTSCWDCHNHEGEADGLQGYNLAMIQAKMITPAGTDTLDLIFKSRGSDASEPTLYSFADADEDGDGDYSGVCEVCHTETSNHQNGLKLPDNSNHAHERGRTCTDCHTHDGGFAGGGPCVNCHDTGGQATQAGRRAIIPELSRTSHHVGSSYVDDDCKVCHDQSKHQQGNVRLWDVDDPDTLTSIVLTGNPLTNSTEAAKLSTFCLKCHDSDGAGGSVPFSDLVTPPEIDATAWAASSHEGSAAIVGCFGDGTFGCHASAHGSEKVSLLAPPESAPTSDFLNEEEEGFCLSCHDSDGPATSNIAVGFADSIRWVPGITGTTNNPNLNDRHDVQKQAQDRSGAAIECTSCHDPHIATSDLPFILDPDPNDGRVPTDTLWDGRSSLQSQFCLDCHDNSFPTGRGVVGQSMTNIFQTWLNTGKDDDGMGVRIPKSLNMRDDITIWTGSAWDTIPLPWTPTDVVYLCEDCHSPHPGAKRNLFSLKDSVTTPTGDPIAYDDVGVTTPNLDYSLTDPANDRTGISNSAYFCNSCHNRTGMNSKDYCYDGCHIHGGSPGI